jgi:hypothetical protein
MYREFFYFKRLDEELYDSTNLDKKEGMEPLINSAAEVKFQLFRQRKTHFKNEN